MVANDRYRATFAGALVVVLAIVTAPVVTVARAAEQWPLKLQFASKGPFRAGDDLQMWVGIRNARVADTVVCVKTFFYDLQDTAGENIGGNTPLPGDTHSCTTLSEKHLVRQGETYFFHVALPTSRSMADSARLRVWVSVTTECLASRESCERGFADAQGESAVQLAPSQAPTGQ
jgi:hypothetical protein